MITAVSMPRTVKPSDWITADEVPDPTPLPKIANWGILVRPVSIVQKTKGGIFIPDTVMDDIARATTAARVLAMGPLCYTAPEYLGHRACEVGDLINYPKMTGNKYRFKGVCVILLDERDVNMVLASAKDIDPSYNLANYQT